MGRRSVKAKEMAEEAAGNNGNRRYISPYDFLHNGSRCLILHLQFYIYCMSLPSTYLLINTEFIDMQLCLVDGVDV